MISLRMKNKTPQIFIDNRKVSFNGLKTELLKMSGMGYVALRRDKTLPCEWEDKIIMLCGSAGIGRVAVMVAAQ